MKVTISFDLDVEAYGEYESTPEAAKELVRAMLQNEADWPWERSPTDAVPRIVVE